MLTGNKEFNMIDEQKVIYEDAISMAIDTVGSNTKNVLIVDPICLDEYKALLKLLLE